MRLRTQQTETTPQLHKIRDWDDAKIRKSSTDYMYFYESNNFSMLRKKTGRGGAFSIVILYMHHHQNPLEFTL
jgi:hypothetical protein